ncbi:hypothetical protein Y900_019640 [Mycolicibacterium aromaticivorans JS19b1 = JCM 16368]|uniref:Uncharacterized protein n=1 Tax=Mycolicibacterium aromaticivorans JS19b1 = JCM 16368 TaxID=1440774 RepID=A0A064CL55_9MYCO|nr:hypothetical protein [Mycolicibacterium aromaticivorans]KDF01086.1 hypothetical protein Y900_019640 [Mycolicibacterium aromaticivorans JS19b1 = JCM 16368]
MHELDQRDPQHEVARSRQRTTRLARYQLDVVGAHVADVVDSAGGWLFDRVMAGWDVRVAVADARDLAALRILGVQPIALRAMFDGPDIPTAFALAGAMCGEDDRVRDVLAASVRSARTEVTVWGDVWLPSVGRRGSAVRHQLSAAATVFKAQATIAAGLGSTVGPFEAFRSYGQCVRTEYPDLLPVG